MTSWTFRAGRLSLPPNRSPASAVRALATTVQRIENRLRPPERTSQGAWTPDMDRPPDDDDAALFRRHVGETHPLRRAGERVAPARPGTHPGPRRPTPVPAPEEDAAAGGRSEPDSNGSIERGSRIEFARPGLQRREIRRLRRGYHPVQDRLDLHGLFASEAERAVLEFIDRSRERGFRCVCIIHGKGRSSAKGRPVLKAVVNRWLRRCEDVLAFCPAPDNAGGTGAVHVLLRT